MIKFIFKDYSFDYANSTAKFNYAYDNGYRFSEEVRFAKGDQPYDSELIKRALFLAFVLIGTSYYKAFPTTQVELGFPIDQWQADFFTMVYQEGLSQFAFENNLKRSDLVSFKANSPSVDGPVDYSGSGILALQSGGKDSLLTATLLSKKAIDFTPWYVASGDFHPSVLDGLGHQLTTCCRKIDRDSLKKAADNGAKNGHVPITYIIQSLAIVQAIILSKQQVITSIGHEGQEAHSMIGDLEVNHQWSKTWQAEQAMADYVNRYISPDIKIGSLLRCFSELRVADLFVKNCWDKYALSFSSCNISNYQQGSDNSQLSWCGQCPKCANSYLLFAPFVKADELDKIFSNQSLFSQPQLEPIFKGLLAIDGIAKPFECVGETNELRKAYHMALSNGYNKLPFEVPDSDFDYLKFYPIQKWLESYH